MSGLVRFFLLMFVWAAAAVSGAFLGELPFLTRAHTHIHTLYVSNHKRVSFSFSSSYFVSFCI